MSKLLRVVVAAGLLSHEVRASSLFYTGNTTSDFIVTVITTNTHYICPCDTTTSTDTFFTTPDVSDEWARWARSTSRSILLSSHGSTSWTGATESTSRSTSAEETTSTSSGSAGPTTLSSTYESATSETTSTSAFSSTIGLTTSTSSSTTTEIVTTIKTTTTTLTSTSSTSTVTTTSASTPTPICTTGTYTDSSGQCVYGVSCDTYTDVDGGGYDVDNLQACVDLASIQEYPVKGFRYQDQGEGQQGHCLFLYDQMPNSSPSTGYAFGQKISCSAPTTTTSTSETTTITSAPTTTASTSDLCSTSVVTVTVDRREDIALYKHLKPRVVDENLRVIAITPTNCATSTTISATTTATWATTTTNSCYPTSISNTCQDQYLFADGDRIYNERCNIQLNSLNAPLNGGGDTTSLLSTCVELCTADVDCFVLSWDPNTNLCKLYSSQTGFGVGSIVAVFKYMENPCSSDTTGSTSTETTTTTTATLSTTSVTTTMTAFVVTPTCAPLSNGDFEEGSNDWSIPILGTDTDSGIYSADDNPWGYTTPHGFDFAMLRYTDNVGLGKASQSLTEMYGTYSVSFSWSIPTMTNRGGDNPFCMVSFIYAGDYFTTQDSRTTIGWTDRTATFTAPNGVSNGEFEIRPFCNSGAIGQCDCDVLVDNVVVTSVNATCAAGGEGGGVAE